MLSILNENDFSGSVSPEKAQTILIWEGDETGKDARTEMTAILSQMRILSRKQKLPVLLKRISPAGILLSWL